jgi:DNA-3-methyladenine glycosylase
MHWLLNAVTGQEGEPAAVLIRGLLPVSGLEWMEHFRPRPAKRSSANPAAGWTDGPAKICQALALGREQNTTDLCDPHSELRIQAGWSIPDDQIVTSARVGLFSVPEPWKSIPWRFQVRSSWLSNFTPELPPSPPAFD